MDNKNKSNVLSFLENKTYAYKDRIALAVKDEYGWKEFTFGGVGLMARRIASYLLNDLKVKREEKIAMLSESKVEFGAAFFASVIAGTTFIPFDIKLTIYELTSIAKSCEPTIIFVSKKYLKTAYELQKEIPSLKTIILLDEAEDIKDIQNVYTLPRECGNVKFRHRNLNSNALIIYTSGTTGRPKGVQITFQNLLSQIEDLKAGITEIFKDEPISIMSILPMNHLFELTFGFSAFLNMGYSIYYSTSLKPKDVLAVMREKKIKFMCTVPSLFKMIKMHFESELSKKTQWQRTLFKFNFHYTAKFLPFKFIKKFLFRDIHAQFGNNFYGFVSGGAPMDLEMGKYFNRIGINAFQAYGLSEASPVVSFNLKKSISMKSVGVKLKSFEIKVDENTKELMVKGPAVMKGYYQQEELTKEVIDEDGWLHTGDIAEINKKGEIFITGRIKNMIVLPGGKKVFPEEVEAALDESEIIKEQCAFAHKKEAGEKKGTEEVCMVVCGIDDLYEKYDDETVEKLLIEEVKKKTLKLSQYKRPTKIIVYKGELPRTATKKVKRNEVKILVGTK